MDKNLEKGKKLIQEVDNEAAVSFLKKALKNEPENAEIYRLLGLAFFNLGQYDEALSHWTKSIKLDPSHHQTLWNIGNLHEIEQRFNDAFKAYNKAAIVAEEESNLVKAKRYSEWAKRVKTK